MARGHKREVRTQVVWEDLRAWVEQLWGTHGVQVEVLIRLVPSKAGIASAVIVNFIRANPGKGQSALTSEWGTFDTKHEGGAEKMALRLVSHKLLQLDNEAAAAEQSALF
jgi:hypothetical protein